MNMDHTAIFPCRTTFRRNVVQSAYGSRSSSGIFSNMSPALMIMIGVLVVVGSVVGYSFVLIGHGSPSMTITNSTSSGSVSTISTYTVVSGTHTETSYVITTIQTSTTNTKSSSGSVGSTETVTSTSDLSTVSTVTTGTTSTTTIGTTSTVTSRTTTAQYESSQSTTSTTTSSSTQSTESTSNVPSVVVLSGSISTTGAGTRANMLTFGDAKGTYTSDVRGGVFSIALPNNESYTVDVSWVGAYPWQSGTINEQLQLFETHQVLTVNWRLQTPNSEVNVSGYLTSTGLDTQATHILFTSVHGSSSGTVISGKYSLLLPNQASYAVSATWSGLYSWQSGVSNLSSIFLNATSSQLSSWNLVTPDSLVTVSGNLTASGIGTHASSLIFVNSNASLDYDTAVISGHYSVTLPNLAEYQVSVGWSGGFTWQAGNVSAGDFSLYQNTTSAVSKNWEVQIPDSEIEVFGSVLTSGGGTQATRILFSGLSGNFTATVSNGKYSIVLPNTVSYEATIFWSGSYSWQNGSIDYQLPVYAGSGSNSFSASWLVPTPNSSVTVTGTVTSQSGYALSEIRFVSTSGLVVTASNIVDNQYSVVLPDEMNFTVLIFVNGFTSPINDGVFELAAPPGATQIIANWIV